MNASPDTAQPKRLGSQDEAGGINLLGLLDLVIDQRWLIGAVLAIALAIGWGYGRVATPIYEANALVQVENRSGGLSSLLDSISKSSDVVSSSNADIEILRSRLVLGQAVRNLQLDLSVKPKYLPVFGQWLARRASEPSEPGFMGFDGYVSGTESLQIGELKLAPALEGTPFTVALTAQGYALRSPEGAALGQGSFGQPLSFKHQGLMGELLVDSAVGKPGAVFRIMRAPVLTITQGLQSQLKINEIGERSGMIRFSLQGTEPQRIARVLNEVGEIYVRQNIERKIVEVDKSIEFLNSQMPILRKELEDTEEKYNQYRKRNGIYSLDQVTGVALEQGVGLRIKRRELQLQIEVLAKRFTAKHPQIQLLALQAKELDTEISRLDSQTVAFPDLQQGLLRAMRDVQVDSALYINLLNTVQQLRLAKEGKVSNVRVIDQAVAPRSPIKPQKDIVMLVAGVLGLLAGVALGALRNALNAGINGPEDIEQHLGLHVFASVPHSKQQEANDVHTNAGKSGNYLLATISPQDPGVESLRSLRTALQFAMLDAANNVVLITGATPGIGKSFITSNFAAVLGSGGKRVLLIDADMRKGHIHQTFGLRRGFGLSDLISGSQAVDQVLHKEVSPRVDFITTGTLPPNPAELMLSPNAMKLMQLLSGQYDIVLIDTPPVLAVSDTLIIASLAATVFIVARAEISSLGEIEESNKRLSQSGVVVRGVILNDVSSRRRYGYGGGYKYARYGYQHYGYGQESALKSK